MDTRLGELKVTHSIRGIAAYSLELWHDGLKKHRLIRDGNPDVVKRKAELQIVDWQDRWQVLSARQRDLAIRTSGKRRSEEQKAFALDATSEAQKALDQLSTILAATIDVNDAVDWERLKDYSQFEEPKPKRIIPHSQPPQPELPKEPKRGDQKYQPSYSLLALIFSSMRTRAAAEKIELFRCDHEHWSNQVEELQARYTKAMIAFEEKAGVDKTNLDTRVFAWEKRKAAFLADQVARNSVIDAKRMSYLASDHQSILEYCDTVLSASRYPDCFPKEFELDYDANSRIVLVDYKLPAPDDMPKLKAIKYIVGKDNFEEQFIAESASTKIYDETIYQTALRTIHELLEADVINAIQAVVFNGIVTSVNRSTGKQVTACLLSLRANRDEFLAINLEQVDPKACFKLLKGVASSKLSGLSPVPPIMKMNREDARFVSAYGVVDSLDDGVNLASMDWKDFEHLIREIFEKEFSSTGGEVRVTQASRDGGVDAIAFDPDPIRGGKIVIQAKRYTNTVGVGAVRDLYGTVLNEGANKGILVTTSDFGPDSYAFANGKPLVLMGGANLLHLLEKHGHKARISIQDARKLVSGK